MSEGIFHEQLFGAYTGLVFDNKPVPEEPELRCRLCECQLDEVVYICPFCECLAPLLRTQTEQEQDIQQSDATLRLKETLDELKEEGR